MVIVRDRIMDWESFSQYLFYERKMSRSKSSVQALKSRFKTLTTYFEGKDFTVENFNLFIASLEEKKYSPSYINNFIKLVKHIDRFLKTDTFKDYTYFYEKQNTELQPLTPEEVDQISLVKVPYARSCNELNRRDYIMIQFAFISGFRKGEIRDLRWSDVRNAPIPHVIARDTKNGEDHMLPLSQQLYELLLSLPHINDFVFASYRGGQIGESEFNVMLKRRADMIKLTKPIYAHLLRHSRGTNLWHMGFGQDQIAKYLNHKDINTTSRYIHDQLEDLVPLAYATNMEQQKVSTQLAEIAKKALSRVFGKLHTINLKITAEGTIIFEITKAT